MKTQNRKKEIMSEMNNMLVDLPTPSNISYMWNMGSMLATCLMLQIVTGILISMHFVNFTQMTFESVMNISRNSETGWSTRYAHSMGANMFFVLVYMHMMRGLFYSSPYTKKHTWMSGMTILVALMATAFLGYVLPWGQMSFWGATVITNIFSAIPYLGKTLVEWMWGGFSVSQPTLMRFFSLHFMLPMVMAALTMIHMMTLHTKGSSNPMGIESNTDKIPFHPFFTSKDINPIVMTALVMMTVISHTPNMATDPENYMEANPLVTPTHIQPEWYFLFAYAILRSIPSKLGGVVALAMSIVAFTIPSTKKEKITSMKYKPGKKTMMMMMIATLVILTWIGANPVEPPFEKIGQTHSAMFFLTILAM